MYFKGAKNKLCTLFFLQLLNFNSNIGFRFDKYINECTSIHKFGIVDKGIEIELFVIDSAFYLHGFARFLGIFARS